jgi:hypothetical protein
MKNFVVAVFLVLWTAQPLLADQDDPCANYSRVLAYSRTSDAAMATLILHEPKTGAEIEMKVPRNFVGIYGNLTDGPQCQLAFELMWPQMTAGGLANNDQKWARDRMMGDAPVSRPLTIDVMVERQAWAHWFFPSEYCHQRVNSRELGDRPYELRALDDGFPWASRRQSDGSYRNMKELVPYPLNEANHFYFLSEDRSEMVSISCYKGVLRCEMRGGFAGFLTTTFFNAEDIANWRTYRDTVRQFLAAHTVRLIPPKTPVATGFHTDRKAPFGVCMRELGTFVGADTLRQMGVD